MIVDREPLSVTEVPTPSQKPTEKTDAPEEKEGVADIEMCPNIEDKEEMIRCKLIACWKDNQYCY